jgi:hypothetical protein
MFVTSTILTASKLPVRNGKGRFKFTPPTLQMPALIGTGKRYSVVTTRKPNLANSSELWPAPALKSNTVRPFAILFDHAASTASRIWEFDLL